MAAHDSKLERSPAHGDRFATTHWSMVVSAGGPRSSEAGQALAILCENYWFPLYAFVRRTGYGPEDAQDLTQEFFLRLLANNYLASVTRWIREHRVTRRCVACGVWHYPRELAKHCGECFFCASLPLEIGGG